jgi:hypothetical protein
MLRVLYITLLFNVSLHAGYTQAYQLFLNGSYAKSIKELKKSKKEYSNPNLHLLWGHSAKELGNLNEAMSAYERVLLLDASNIQAQNALNAIYKKTDRDTLLSPQNKLTTLKTFLSVAFGYDDNLNATPDSDTLLEYVTDVNTVNSSHEKSSPFSQLAVSLTYTDELEEKGGWYAKYALKGFLQHHTQSTFYNLKTFSLEAGLGHNTDRYNIYLPLSYHRIHYLGEDLLAQYRFHPSLFVPIGKENIFNLNVIYSENKYNDKKNKIKNDTTIAIEVGNYFLFQKDFVSVHLKYEHHSDIKSISAKYVAAKFWTLKLGSKYSFTPKFTALLNYRFRYGQYKDVVGTTFTKRDDNFHQLDSKLLYEWSKSSSLFLSHTYTNNLSNFPLVEYDKNMMLFGIEFSY